MRLLNLVAINQVLIPEIKFSVDHHRVRPDLATRGTDLGLWIESEASMLFEAFGGSVDEHDLSAAFIDADELSVSHSNGSLSKGSFFGPNFLPAFQILAQPAHSIGVTKDVSTHLNGAAMMILHQAIGVEFLDLHLFVNLDGLATDAHTPAVT